MIVKIKDFVLEDVFQDELEIKFVMQFVIQKTANGTKMIAKI